MRVLFILNHAPDYRERFLRMLGHDVELTVVAQPCLPDGLHPPERREAYQYIEVAPFQFAGFRWQKGLADILRSQDWDIICVSANMRQLSRISLFLGNPEYRRRWIWWGLIFGENDSRHLAAVKKRLISRAAACLVHSRQVERRLMREFGVQAQSFNNTQTLRAEYRDATFSLEKDVLKLLFVGTNKPRKRLDRLVAIAERRRDVAIRVIGPGMDTLGVPVDSEGNERLKAFGRTTGADLNRHFDWCDFVVSPGNAGLLVQLAAQHGKGIVVDRDSYHGPEVELAHASGQPFIDFGCTGAVDRFIDSTKGRYDLLSSYGRSLREVAREEYSLENMVRVHLDVFARLDRENRR
ncbi:glycosyltransferase family protein [Lentisalinibacter salinarum]|uniref:hypothetical protein n=1 Tax=Lentisalinibacter salinarum TaxID=2992239 RepID=UPI00386E0ED5